MDDFYIYWPCAVYLKLDSFGNWSYVKQSTYDGELSLVKCQKVFSAWEEAGLYLLVTFAQIYKNGEKVGIYEFTNSGCAEAWWNMAALY